MINDRLFYDQSRGQHQPDIVKWLDYRRALSGIPAEVRSWLLDDGSLTLRLQAASRDRFEVELLAQCWANPLPHERKVLDLKARETAQVRETLLKVDDVPWVFARSIIPVHSLTGNNRRLRFLGSRSLGSWLFQSRDLTRSRFQVARLAPDCQMIPGALQQGRPLWGRRSRFEVGSASLLVCEIFLPPFQPWAGSVGNRLW